MRIILKAENTEEAIDIVEEHLALDEDIEKYTVINSHLCQNGKFSMYDKYLNNPFLVNPSRLYVVEIEV